MYCDAYNSLGLTVMDKKKTKKKKYKKTKKRGVSVPVRMLLQEKRQRGARDCRAHVQGVHGYLAHKKQHCP